MRPAEEIEKFIENVPLETLGRRDREVLDDALRALRESKEHTKRQPKIWKAIMKNKMTKLAAAAMIVLAVLIGIGTLDRTSAWAEVLRALEDVNHVHIVSTLTLSDGTEAQSKYWLRKPDCIRQEEPDRIVIDNGQERLTIDREKKEAQFEDSLVEYQPVSDHYMFEQIGMFRGHEVEGLTVKKLEDESGDNIRVFRLDYEATHSQLAFEGKAWVDNNTMLPARVTLQLRGEPKKGEPQGAEVTFDYSPIPDDAFDRVVPNGYTILPRKRPQAISGRVVNIDGTPVDGAVVHLTDKWLRFLRKVETDNSGEFVFELPPSKVHWVGLPVFLRAVPQNDPGRVAWTIVEDPEKRKDLGVTIPGQTGHVKMNTGLRLQSVDGIVLQMESAGTISGHVTDMLGDPISGAEVVIEGRAIVRRPGMAINPEFGFIGDPLGGNGPRGQLTTSTDEQGRYEVTNVPKFSSRARYKITANARGFAPNEQRRDSTWKSDVEEVNIKLYHAGITVSGTLVDNYGQPLEMRRIFGRVEDRDFCNTKTDEKGRFVLKDCPISPKLQIKAELSHISWPPHEKQKYGSYTYYPNVIVPVDYIEGTAGYEVKLVAEKPEFVVEVVIKDAAGEPLPYFPVEVRGAAGSISSQWAADKKLGKRTDERGYCKLVEVPNVESLRLVAWGGASVWNDSLGKEQAKKIREKYAKYEWKEVPLQVVPGQKEYRIEMTLLTIEKFNPKQ
jgi:outer membrane lipoprotein-sorting protein